METTREQLKIIALQERLLQVMTEYEDKDIERRLYITELGDELAAVTAERDALRAIVEDEGSVQEENSE